MAKYCTNCGNKVNEEADVCLKCGKYLTKDEIKKNNKIGPIGIIIIIIASIIAIAFMIITFIAIIEESIEEYDETIEQIPIPPHNNIGTIDDSLYYGNLEFKFNSAQIHEYIEVQGDKKLPQKGYEYLILNFTVNNQNDDEYNLDINKFKGYSDEKNINIITNIDNKLNGIIESKMSLTGNIVFEIKKDWSNFKISYDENYKEQIIFKIVSPDNNKYKEIIEF